MIDRQSALLGMSEAAKAMAHACLDLSHYAAVLADEKEREQDADGPVRGDGPQVATGCNASGQVVSCGQDGTISGNGYRTLSSGHRYAYYNAPGNPDSGP